MFYITVFSRQLILISFQNPPPTKTNVRNAQISCCLTKAGVMVRVQIPAHTVKLRW